MRSHRRMQPAARRVPRAESLIARDVVRDVDLWVRGDLALDCGTHSDPCSDLNVHLSSIITCGMAWSAIPAYYHLARPPRPSAKTAARSTFCESVERLVLVAKSWQVQEGIGSVALHAHQVQVTTKVPRVRARDRQAVAEPRQRCFGAVVPDR